MSDPKQIIDRITECDMEALNDMPYGCFKIDPRSLDAGWSKIQDSLDEISADPMIMSKEDLCVPFDAELTVKGEDIVLEGYASDDGYGECSCKYPKADAVNYFDICIEPTDEFAGDIIRDLLDEAEIRYVFE